MTETITIKKKDFEHIRKGIFQSMELIEEIEFHEGVKKGREQFKAGEFVAFKDYKKK